MTKSTDTAAKGRRNRMPSCRSESSKRPRGGSAAPSKGTGPVPLTWTLTPAGLADGRSEHEPEVLAPHLLELLVRPLDGVLRRLLVDDHPLDALGDDGAAVHDPGQRADALEQLVARVARELERFRVVLEDRAPLRLEE